MELLLTYKRYFVYGRKPAASETAAKAKEESEKAETENEEPATKKTKTEATMDT